MEEEDGGNVELVDTGVQWRLPRQGFVKINVHACFFEEPLPNGNTTGIGYVFRNDRERIVRMVAGSLRIQERRINKFYAMLMGLRRAYLEIYTRIMLETDNAAAYWEWRFSNEGVIPEHRYVVNQLNQRKADRNQILEYGSIREEANELARYLAHHGAHTWTRLVIITAPFGRTRELWANDLGLGPLGEQFEEVLEEDLQAEIAVKEEVAVEAEVMDDLH